MGMSYKPVLPRSGQQSGSLIFCELPVKNCILTSLKKVYLSKPRLNNRTHHLRLLSLYLSLSSHPRLFVLVISYSFLWPLSAHSTTFCHFTNGLIGCILNNFPFGYRT